MTHRPMHRTRHRGAVALTAVAAIGLVLAACGPVDSPSPTDSTGATASTQPAASGEPSAAASPPLEQALACPDNPRPISDEQRIRVLALAQDRLARAARDTDRVPFGALANDSVYERTRSDRWTTGFFPAELWRMASLAQDGSVTEPTDTTWLDLARTWSSVPIGNADLTTTHDLGFMVGLPMSLAMSADPQDEPAYRDAFTQAARSLATRWNPVVGAIQSGDYDGQFGVIVDSAMNQPLLIEGGRMIGGSDGDAITALGIEHLRFLQRHFIRPDGSTAHRITFDTSTGAPIGEVPGQGAGEGSTWARGQAWAAHGFAEAWALTGDTSFRDSARLLADFWIARVPAGCIPTWDLDLVDGPADTPLDSSALAILAHGLLILAETEESAADGDAARAIAYRTYAQIALGTLARDRNLTDGTENPGILLRQTYNVPKDPRSGSYVWGDAYLLLAITR